MAPYCLGTTSACCPLPLRHGRDLCEARGRFAVPQLVGSKLLPRPAKNGYFCVILYMWDWGLGAWDFWDWGIWGVWDFGGFGGFGYLGVCLGIVGIWLFGCLLLSVSLSYCKYIEIQ
jgi:hypothetical protein